MKRSSFLTLMCCVLQSKSWAITEKPATYAPPWSGALADLGIIATYSVKGAAYARVVDQRPVG
jgi:hypothetical protein